MRRLPCRVVDGTQPELEIAAVIAGELNCDIDEGTRLVLARDEAPSVLPASLVVTLSIEWVAADSTPSAIAIVLRLQSIDINYSVRLNMSSQSKLPRRAINFYFW